MQFSNKKADKAEIDFIIEQKENIIPIEVKSGASGHLKSLAYYMFEKQHPLACRLDLRYRSHDYVVQAKIPVMSDAKKQVSVFELHNWPVFYVTAIKNLCK